MKPNWHTAPVWAEYAAEELSGTWYWHEYRPRFVEIIGEWRSDGRTEIVPRITVQAKDSLEIRP